MFQTGLLYDDVIYHLSSFEDVVIYRFGQSFNVQCSMFNGQWSMIGQSLEALKPIDPKRSL